MRKVTYICIVILLVIQMFPAEAAPIRVKAGYAIAIDARSRAVLYEKDAHKPVPMASTTKIVTALIALNYGNLEEKIAISKNAASVRGSKAGYKAGEEILLKELVYALMLKSGNDAAIAIAEGISGSQEKFAKLMNEYGKNMGLLNTSFESPHGLDSTNHFSTAYDLAVATIKAEENPLFCSIVATKVIKKEDSGFTRDYNNINKILWRDDKASGVKTGYTGKAGKCLVSSFKKEGNSIIIVMLNSNDRFNETIKLYKNILEEYDYTKVVTGGEELKKIVVANIELTLGLLEDLVLPVKKGKKITYEIHTNNFSLRKGDNIKELGKIKIFMDGEFIYESPLKILSQRKSS